MKKAAVISSTLAAVLVSGALSVTAFAATNPADDASSYSYNAGKQSYETRMAENPDWFDNEDSTNPDYSWNAGAQAAQSRGNAFAQMPAGDNLSEEELDAFFQENGIGSGSAYANGEYDESAKSGYGYSKGQAAYQERHASFTGSN